MSEETAFLVVFGLFAAYIIFGNYVYWNRVLPTLRAAGKPDLPLFLPSGQFAQIRECVRILALRGERGFVYWFLRVTPILGLILVIVWLVLVIGLLWVRRGSPTSGWS